MSHPGNLRSKALYMILFLLKQTLRNKQRKINIFNSRRLESFIQLFLNQLPYSISCGLQNHETFYACVTCQICFNYNICIPFGKILFHRGNCFDLLISHNSSFLYLLLHAHKHSTNNSSIFSIYHKVCFISIIIY